MSTVFFDSTNPEMIPASARYAALYFDGRYGATGRQNAWRFAHRRWITDHNDYIHCGIVDFEPGNPSYGDVTALSIFTGGRAKMGKEHRVYCDRADAKLAIERLDGRETLWWIATLDGKQWTAEELAADLKDNWGADIPADHIWGNQNRGDGVYDSSSLFLEW
jgi:hypothetical protein